MTVSELKDGKECEVCGGRAMTCAVLGHRPSYDRTEWRRTRASAWRPDEGELWSLIRRVLEQGAAIQQDYTAGNHKGGYEEYSARMDLAARERVAQFLALPAPPTGEKP